jgi:hypothetical protein
LLVQAGRTHVYFFFIFIGFFFMPAILRIAPDFFGGRPTLEPYVPRPCGICASYFLFFAVLADALKAAAVGAPLAPGLRMEPLPVRAIRFLLAWMLAYKPGFLAIVVS